MQFRNLIKNAIAPYADLFRFGFRIGAKRAHQPLLINKDTQLVIEGFPRSANTFAVVAFIKSQDRDVAIAHHLHAVAQVKLGVRQGVPVIVLIRRPEDAVRSLKVIFKQRNRNSALKNWLRFYEEVEPLRSRVVIADFDRVIGDFGAVIDEVNAHYGTTFGRFESTPENVQAVFDRIDAIIHGVDHKTEGGKEMYVSRPTEAKRAAQEKVELDLDPKLLARANALYERLTASA